MKHVADALEEGRRATSEERSRATGVPATSVFRILTYYLKKITFSMRWVFRCLTAEQKQKRLDFATLLKERFDVDQTYISRIVAIHETWITDFEPELKSQSNSPLGKKKKIDELNQRSSK